MKLTFIISAIFSVLAAAAPADNESQDESDQVVANYLLSSEMGLTDSGGSTPTRDENVIRETVKWAEENLDDLFQQLGSYTHLQLFSFSGFESQTANLESRINEIARTTEDIEKLDPENSGLLIQTRFAQLVYYDMLSALSLYKAFPINGIQGHAILRNLVQMNVCLFTLRDHKGTPDPSIKNYTPLMRSTISELDNTMSYYGKHGKVSSVLDSVIKIQLKKLWNTISELKNASIGLSKETWKGQWSAHIENK